MVTVAFVADDFTGATDALWQYQRFGLRSRLFTSLDELSGSALDGLDVVGVATTARAASGDGVLTVALPAIRAVAALGPRIVQYKVCSTFDSSPDVGSIGRVVDAVYEWLGTGDAVPVLPAQPEFGRYTAFGNHFARYAGEVHRLDRHEPMRTHPSTPVDDADLRRHLGRQLSSGRVGLLPTPVLDAESLGPALRSRLAGEDRAFVVDAMTDTDLVRFGAAFREAVNGRGPEHGRLPERDPAEAPARGPVFAVGSGGLSYGLAADIAAERHGPVVPETALGRVAATRLPLLVVSGSCSPVTAEQIAVAEAAGWASVDIAGPDPGRQAIRHLAEGRHSIVYSARGAATGRDPAGVNDVLSAVVVDAVAAGVVGRLVVAGGDTSGAVLGSVGVASIEILGSIAVAGPLCRVGGRQSVLDGHQVVLKGGQVGQPDFFLRAAGLV